MSPTLTLLIVDDHSFLRRGLRSFFERGLPGASVAEAASAEQAYEMLQQSPVEVVIIDLDLPGDNGIEAATKIRASHSKTKVIILSGQSGRSENKGQVRKAILAGVSGFVSKADGDDFALWAIHAARKGQVFLSPTPATELARDLRYEATIVQEKGEMTDQELAVLKRLAEGGSYKEIAEELGIGARTVDTYRTRLTKKLGIASREELQTAARRFGLVP